MSKLDVNTKHWFSKKGLSAIVAAAIIASQVTIGGLGVSAASLPFTRGFSSKPHFSTLTGDATSSNATSGDASISYDAGGFWIESGTLKRYNGSGGNVTIPSGVTGIGDGAFSGCTGLTGVTIPSGVTSIGDGAFSGCKGLTGVTIPSGVTSIGDSAFEGTGLTSVIIPSSVTSIESGAFEGTGLTSVTIPSGVTSIGEGAFYGCTGLTDVSIPSSVTDIGMAAFTDTPWLNSQAGDADGFVVAGNGVLIVYKGSGGAITIPSGVTSIGDGVFAGCTNLTSVTIPSGVTSIGDWAFIECTNLTSVTIPSSVTGIGDEAFDGTSWLNSQTGDFVVVNGILIDYKGSGGAVTVPSGVTGIGNEVFGYNHINVTSVTIPSSVTSIGDGAFAWNNNLTAVNVDSGNSVYSSYDGVLFNKGQTKLLQYPLGKKGAFAIPPSMTRIDDGTFSGCENLTSVTIPSSVKSIGDYAFEGSGLTSVDIPSTVKSVGDEAFAYCASLKTAAIESGVSTIGNWAFYGDTGLTSVSIPSSVKNLGGAAFELCSALTSVTIANGATGIGKWTFHDCTSLKSLTISSSVTSIGDDAFKGDGNLTLTVDSGSYAETYAKKNNIKYVLSGFSNAKPLTDIDIPANGATVSSTAAVSGWALNTSGINRVDIYVYDSKNHATFLGSVPGSSLSSRSDVQKSFANDGYANIANSGYSKTVDFSGLPNGTYTLAVAGIGNNGIAQWETKSIKVSLPQPLTDIDAPANGATVADKVTVSGWALNASGIGRVDIYVFDSKNKATMLGSVGGGSLTNRGDVQKSFANDGYANIASSAYSQSVDTTRLPSGTYTLAVAGIGKNNTVQWATRTIRVGTAQPLTDIDAPANGAAVSGKVTVSGWALNASGIGRVDIYAFDSKNKATMLGSVGGGSLTNRGDVQKAFANDGYANIASSAYSQSVDTAGLPSGTYTLAVAGIGKNGVVQWAARTIKVGTAQPLTDIDAPANGATVSGKVTVSGWALNASGIGRVDIYAFDSKNKATMLGSVEGNSLTNRGDVQKAFANDGYANIASSAYSQSVDTTRLANGTYTLSVAGIGKNGVVQWETKTITVRN